MANNRVICDSSSLISLSMNCMTPILADLSESTDFIITKSVYDEVVTTPRHMEQHKLAALKFLALVQSGIITVEEADRDTADDILSLSNSIFYARQKPLQIIQRGEAEALALACKGKCALLMDERTLRFLIEGPNDLKELLQHRMHKGVMMDRGKAAEFKKYSSIPVIRSSEVVAIAYEKGILQKYFFGEKKELLEACLWGLKLKGCSLAVEDIQEYLRMVK